jgi:hypothetical protein
MKKLVMALALLIIPAAANARDTTLPCFKVDDENTPAVTLSGRITKHHRSPPKDSELQAVKNFYFVKLDSPLRVDNGAAGGCQSRDEIPIIEQRTPTQLVRWNNQHVTIEGKLGRFPSALAYPAIFIEISTIKGD